MSETVIVTIICDMDGERNEVFATKVDTEGVVISTVRDHRTRRTTNAVAFTGEQVEAPEIVFDGLRSNDAALN